MGPFETVDFEKDGAQVMLLTTQREQELENIRKTLQNFGSQNQVGRELISAPGPGKKGPARPKATDPRRDANT